MSNKRKKYNNNFNISGLNIKKIRNEKKISREALSNKLLLEENLDLRPELITKIENNNRTVCDYELKFLSKVLNVDISKLLD